MNWNLSTSISRNFTPLYLKGEYITLKCKNFDTRNSQKFRSGVAVRNWQASWSYLPGILLCRTIIWVSSLEMLVNSYSVKTHFRFSVERYQISRRSHLCNCKWDICEVHFVFVALYGATATILDPGSEVREYISRQKLWILKGDEIRIIPFLSERSKAVFGVV